MKPNPQDKVVEKVLERQKKFSDYISKTYKVEPFAKEDIPAIEQIWAVDNAGWQDKQELINEYGIEAVARVLSNTEKLRQDGRRK